MRLRRARERDFGFDAAGRRCELSRADRNRWRRAPPSARGASAVRCIGARPAGYAEPPDIREWHRAFAKLPDDVALVHFKWHGPYHWQFRLVAENRAPCLFTPTCHAPLNENARELYPFDRRRHPRRAVAIVRDARRRLLAPLWPI